ncbi:MAG: NADH:ubiquinone reductase (Na(+)-transporting) subunit C [Verrucomicrobia bacterium]|nr:NADH:ubiquinone reductase (Na(+)-transporting) subunit C [Verrucomicrobiota bacterium]
MQKDDLRIVGFAAVVCIVCSLVLSATASMLKQRQAENVELDRKINVLKAFGVAVVGEDGKKISKDRVDQYFSENISEIYIAKDSGEVVEGMTLAKLPKEELKAKTAVEKTMLPLYLWKEDGKVRKYAFPISGMGLWSILNGYLALDSDLSTIVGLTFYKHAETPGLGGECSSDWFQNQFKGKKVFEDGKLLQFEVAKGSAEIKYPGGSDHAVDGISGATMTGNGINRFLNRDLQYYEKYFSRIRG